MSGHTARSVISPNEIKLSVHPELEAQMTLYEEPRIITTLGHIHTAHCYAGSNCTLIEGEDGAVLLDTLSGELSGDKAAAAFKEITDKPIKAVIVTHFHPDHVSGIFSFISEKEVRSGAVEVIGQKELTNNILRDAGILAPIRNRRDHQLSVVACRLSRFDLTPQPYCSPEPLTQEQLYLQINQILPACHQLVAAPNDKSK